MTDEQYKLILKRYQNLMYMIAHRIGGDPVTHDFDDSLQELALSAMDAVRTFEKNTKTKFDEFWGSVEFDKYIKTCLWNKKNNRGRHIQKRRGIDRHVSLSSNPVMWGEELCYEQNFSSVADVEVDGEVEELIDILLADTAYFKPNGRINITKVADRLVVSKNRVRQIIEKVEKKFADYKEEA
jgi:hypothetical protein